jgi:hypothetical protein
LVLIFVLIGGCRGDFHPCAYVDNSFAVLKPCGSRRVGPTS